MCCLLCGKVALFEDCQELATFVLFVAVVLCQKYAYPVTREVVRTSVCVCDGGVSAKPTFPFVQVPRDVMCKYRTVFHPTAFLRREVGLWVM